MTEATRDLPTQPSRRKVLAGVAGIAAALEAGDVNGALASIVEADADLIALRDQLDDTRQACRLFEREFDALGFAPDAPEQLTFDREFMAFCDAECDILQKIVSTPAKTLKGLLIKGYGVACCHGDDWGPQAFLAEAGGIDLQLLWSILIDLAAMDPSIPEAASNG